MLQFLKGLKRGPRPKFKVFWKSKSEVFDKEVLPKSRFGINENPMLTKLDLG